MLGAHDVPAARRRARRGPRAARPARRTRPTPSPSCSPSARTSCGRGTSASCKGPAKWTYFYLYVILDVFSRYVVGWTVQHRENGRARQGADRAGRPSSSRSRPKHAHAARRPRRADARQAGRVPARRPRRHQDATAGRTPPTTTRTRRRSFKTLKYRPEFPDRFDTIEHAREHCRAFFDWYNHEHRHSGIGLMTPAAVHHGHAQRAARRPRRVLDAAYAAHPERFVRKPPVPPELPTAAWINKPRHERGRSLNSNTKRLTGLDRLRATRLSDTRLSCVTSFKR